VRPCAAFLEIHLEVPERERHGRDPTIQLHPAARWVYYYRESPGERAEVVRTLPTYQEAAELIEIHPSGITRAVAKLGIEPQL
jgi:hypothetical protein